MIFCDIALLAGARDFGDGQCEDAFFYKRLDVVCRNVFYIGLTEKDSEKLRKFFFCRFRQKSSARKDQSIKKIPTPGNEALNPENLADGFADAVFRANQIV